MLLYINNIVLQNILFHFNFIFKLELIKIKRGGVELIMEIQISIKEETDKNPEIENENYTKFIRSILNSFPDAVWQRGKKGYSIML